MKPQDLLPCPFCGSVAAEEPPEVPTWPAKVGCRSCTASAELSEWNRRSTAATEPASEKLTIWKIQKRLADRRRQLSRDREECDSSYRQGRAEEAIEMFDWIEQQQQEAQPGASPNGEEPASGLAVAVDEQADEIASEIEALETAMPAIRAERDNLAGGSGAGGGASMLTTPARGGKQILGL